VQGGARVVELQRSLAERVVELEQALNRVKLLQGLLPICSYCKKIRDDRNYWRQVEAYISEHSEAVFSHGICPECFEKFVKPQLNKPAESGGTP
ncbi:MAG: response regulator, partial [Acidobacteriia bacterium]|nr:response regulator [Terriglobia bacterium]